ncbi:acetyl-coenzyme A carboxyl transferase beta chain [Agrilactobacillus composti DSM 18527 = JCM 14202]|nr:acetyl-coenzyme A carboxyl transferase beta chain [Agrilactobacillus composti DSM 18527 = JCM 14202]
MNLFKRKPYVETHPHRQPERHFNQKVPDNMFIQCPHCKEGAYYKAFGAFRVCPNCGYGMRLKAQERLDMLTADYTPWDTELQTKDPLNFPGYDQKLAKAQAATGSMILFGPGKPGSPGPMWLWASWTHFSSWAL